MWVKIIFFLVSVAAILFAGFIGFVASAFAGQSFYSFLVLIFAVFFLVLSFVSIFRLLNFKKIRIIFGIIFFVLISVVGLYELNKTRVENIPTMSDRGVDLNLYKPFMKGSKVVSLGEPSNLKIETNLPKLDGATALYPLYSSFVRAVYPEKDYLLSTSEVKCESTIQAYQNLISGQADIIFAAKPSENQLNEALKEGVELKLNAIGREAFVFFVNSKNPIEALSVSQIQDIYSGKITNWKEVGGNNEKIIAFQRPEGSGSQTMLQKLMEGKYLVEPPIDNIPGGMGDIIRQTADYKNYKNAIGYSFLFFATEMVKNDQIKLLKVDNVYPNKENIKNKKYPLVSDFYAVTAGSENPNIDQFIDWMLSPQGQILVEKTGYSPVK